MTTQEVLKAAGRAQQQTGISVNTCDLLIAVDSFLGQVAASSGWKFWVKWGIAAVRAAVRLAHDDWCIKHVEGPQL